jgi:transposase
VDAARGEALEQIHRSPALYGAARSRWTLALLQRLCPVLAGLGTLAGVWRRLRKWRIRRKRGRQHVTSPDPSYATKVAAVQAVDQQARTQPEQMVLLYSDEFTFYRQPSVGLAYHEQGSGGKHQPRAERSYAKNTKYRVVAVLDAVRGRVLFTSGSKIGVKALCRFLPQVRVAYGESVRIVWVWDNWPVHLHPEVVTAAQAQRIELLYLPTYAPWTNPIEKLWGKLQAELLAMHAYSDRWSALKERVQEILRGYDRPAADLLRYVGLLPD